MGEVCAGLEYRQKTEAWDKEGSFEREGVASATVTLTEKSVYRMSQTPTPIHHFSSEQIQVKRL